MNIKSNTFGFAAPVFVLGAVLVAASSARLEQGGHFEYQPNPGALAKSPFGRTVGMALQGPITRFWDRGVGKIEKKAELQAANRPDEQLFNWVTELREAKTEVGVPVDLSDQYSEYAMARIEKKLSLAWKMDPRNFANYAIYQMFLWEGFNDEVINSELKVRELSLKTLETSLADKESPVSLLTAGQAAYDLVFAARTSKDQDPAEALADIRTYSRMLPEIISGYDEVVEVMKADGRWDKFSDIKKLEFSERKAYLDHLNNETRNVAEQLTQSSIRNEEGHNS
ncbi:hypothetical protein AAFN60_07240 [Roseibacillus persicicus]|uniref:hypothetical protein n=1 Tax=Roseibacillus persicicus TaxID=454148 RepID=UPI00398B8E5D